ncbi:MAG: type I asparaginase [Bacteroidales bacterium]|jgi:L-asparaginase|nr:type I asparaginase [Bacteroidales bacterium]MCK9448663.1 type I asparaginase [Bacteroidales bacterium]MDD3702200.1 type I asparaginase [Bacteroidales bacterium]MDY0368926.1 type I asparaginase [Bacteroidales bacterium]
MTEEKISLLVIYTGGTIGMAADPETGALVPFDFGNIYEQMPALRRFDFKIDFEAFDPLIDSSNMNPSFWIKLAGMIEAHYDSYDGFVVLHGSDTMAYTASALSFMLENLNKPVILTGSQLPMGVIRTDGRENFLTSLEIAAAKENGIAIVPEVAIYFKNELLRGNRATKFNAERFNAFVSGNYPALAEVGVHIRFKKNSLLKPNFKKLKIHTKLDFNVTILKLFPGISENVVKSTLNIPGLKALILETFGSGNAPTDAWFINALDQAIQRGLIVYNVTQCKSGSVELGKYETSLDLERIGVISGYDITTESALSKLMYLIGEGYTREKIIELLQTSLRGEMTID